MRRYVSLFPAALLVIFFGSCSAPKPYPEMGYRSLATMRDILYSKIEPSARFIWQAVGTTITPKGSVIKEPATDEEWAEVRRRAITLIESSNLLIMPGRQ